jgi:hypothetical protein
MPADLPNGYTPVVAHPRELARRAAAAIAFDLAFVAIYVVVEFGRLTALPPFVTAWALVGALPWLLLTLNVLTRFALGHGGRSLIVQLNVPGARLIASLLVLLTWPLALLIPLIIYMAAAHATAAALVGPHGLIALRPIFHLPIGLVGLVYLAIVGVLFAARSPSAPKSEVPIPDFDPERLLRLTLPVGCGLMGVALGHLGASLDEIGLPTDTLVLALYFPLRYLIERVGGITWISVLTSILAVIAAVIVPLRL